MHYYFDTSCTLPKSIRIECLYESPDSQYVVKSPSVIKLAFSVLEPGASYAINSGFDGLS